MDKKVFEIRVNHSLGFFTIYDDIKALNYWDAEKIARQRFLKEFCGNSLETKFRGEVTKHSLETYVFNKYNS